MTFTFTIFGTIRSGKNNMIVLRNGMHIPKKEWATWRDGIVVQMRSAWGRSEPLSVESTINIDYFPGDLRRRDVPGMTDALFHCFERAKIITDDTLFKHLGWITRDLDRQNPRVEVQILSK